jgi:protoheme IX farnesyltransferase
MKDSRAAAADTIAQETTSTSRLGDYLALSKPRLNGLVVASSAAGYYLGTSGRVDPTAMAAAVVGTALVAGGAAALNQVFERDVDALMRRTRWRPLPDGRVSPADAATFGVGLSVAGLLLLGARANLLSAALALATITVYLMLYTPLKRKTPFATLVGAIPGALPPVIGWAASHGSIGAGGLALFALVFVWQIPHFMAISWLYRDDYATARFPMLSVVDKEGRRVGRHALAYSAALVPVSLAPAVLGISGSIYIAVALVLGIGMAVLARQFARARDDRSARLLFFASIVYLPLIWISLIVDRL